MPSIVVTSLPAAWTASSVQLLTDSPSTWHVQAPQLDVSQPMCVPVSPSGVADEMDEQQSRLDHSIDGLTVDGHLQGDGGAHAVSFRETARIVCPVRADG